MGVARLCAAVANIAREFKFKVTLKVALTHKASFTHKIAQPQSFSSGITTPKS